jgi:outer membrane protein assembly factor BamB
MRRSLLLLLVLSAAATTALGANWSNWRGPELTGVSREKGLPARWALKGKNTNLLWSTPVGAVSSPIVQDGQVYIITKTGKGERLQERVVALNADTGKLVWEHKFNVWLTDIVDDRVCWAHMAGDPETGNVYSHGTQGLFTCFSKDGKVLWQRSLTEEFGRVSGYGGRLPSPFVDEGLVIIPVVNAAWGKDTVGQTRLIAFDKRKGHVVWIGRGGYRVADTHYSCPVAAVIGGQRLIVAGGGDGCVHAWKARTGEKVWSLKFGPGGVNCTPVVQGNRVWIGHGEEDKNTQGRVICVDGSIVEDGKPKVLWSIDGIKVKYASPLLLPGMLIVCDDLGNMFCLDPDSGKQLWDFSYGANTRGSPVWADGRIYISELDSKFHILKADRMGCESLNAVTFRSRGTAPVELHSSPAVYKGRVYVVTTQDTFCIAKPDHKAKAGPIPPGPKEEPLPKGAKAAHVQIIPADVTLKPGESQEFTARAFDDRGRLIGEVKADWSLAGPGAPIFPIGLDVPKKKGPPAKAKPLAGSLSAESGKKTTLTVAKAPNGQFGRVVASFDGVKGEARVRVVPTLPYTMNFDNLPDGSIPGGWVNTQAKYAVTTLPDGNKVLSKRNDNTNLLVARGSGYIGPPSMSDYTIEADVLGTQVGADLPEIGIGACRYSLVLVGGDKELRLVSWDAQKRISKVVPFPWKPDVWYRMKLMATVQGGKGIIKGKMWERGAPEPAAWTVEAEDPVPNTEGAPLVYGWSRGIMTGRPGTKIYYDNLKITPNP